MEERVYQEEVRDGYTVPATMKKVWAVELDLLARFQDMCRQEGLTYYAAGGTLLGAVRHGGFIPWDNDIDILMFRDEYERMRAVAPAYFPPPYFFQTVDTDVKYSRAHAQIRHSHTTALLPHEGRAFPFNQGIFIDIFPLDAVPDDARQWKRQQRAILFWTKLLDSGVRYPANPHKTPLKNIAHACASLLPYRWVFRRLEAAARRYNEEHTARVGPIAFLPTDDNTLFLREDYAAAVPMPFEDGTVDVPVGYDRLLRTQYGDYRTPVQAPSYHGDVTFDAERSYRDYIK